MLTQSITRKTAVDDQILKKACLAGGEPEQSLQAGFCSAPRLATSITSLMGHHREKDGSCPLASDGSGPHAECPCSQWPGCTEWPKTGVSSGRNKEVSCGTLLVHLLQSPQSHVSGVACMRLLLSRVPVDCWGFLVPYLVLLVAEEGEV